MAPDMTKDSFKNNSYIKDRLKPLVMKYQTNNDNCYLNSEKETINCTKYQIKHMEKNKTPEDKSTRRRFESKKDKFIIDKSILKSNKVYLQTLDKSNMISGTEKNTTKSNFSKYYTYKPRDKNLASPREKSLASPREKSLASPRHKYSHNMTCTGSSKEAYAFYNSFQKQNENTSLNQNIQKIGHHAKKNNLITESQEASCYLDSKSDVNNNHISNFANKSILVKKNQKSFQKNTAIDNKSEIYYTKDSVKNPDNTKNWQQNFLHDKSSLEIPYLKNVNFNKKCYKMYSNSNSSNHILKEQSRKTDRNLSPGKTVRFKTEGDNSVKNMTDFCNIPMKVISTPSIIKVIEPLRDSALSNNETSDTNLRR